MNRLDVTTGTVQTVAESLLGDFAVHGALLGIAGGIYYASQVFGGLIGDSFAIAAGIFIVTMLISFGFHVVQHGVMFDQAIKQCEHLREIEYLKNSPPEPVKPIVEPSIPFPPEMFVTYLWNERIKNGKVPTVNECIEARFNPTLVVKWFEELVNAGTIIGREQRAPGVASSSGDFAPAWTFDRCVAASRRANTITALPR